MILHEGRENGRRWKAWDGICGGQNGGMEEAGQAGRQWQEKNGGSIVKKQACCGKGSMGKCGTVCPTCCQRNHQQGVPAARRREMEYNLKVWRRAASGVRQ